MKLNMRHVVAWLAAAGLACLALACSSAPKTPAVVNDRKNDAAGYTELADGFLAKGQYASAMQYYNEALETNLLVDNVEGAIASRSSLGRVYLLIQEYELAEREMLDALRDARAFGSDSLIALCLSNFGELRFAQGKAEEAEAAFTEAQGKAASDERLMAIISHNRAVAAIAKGDLASAISMLEVARAANEKAKRWTEYAANCYVLATALHKKGDTAAAFDLLKKALEADKTAENSRGILADLEGLGKLAKKLGKNAEAFDYQRRAFNLALLLNEAKTAERCLIALIDLSKELGYPEYEKRYTGLLDKLRSSTD